MYIGPIYAYVLTVYICIIQCSRERYRLVCGRARRRPENPRYADGERASELEKERERECVFVCVYYPPTDGYKRGAAREREGEGGKAGGWLCIYINT